MTSYTQTDSYFNEIDALSWKSRPICSTLNENSSYNAYESQTEDETGSYGWCGNQEYIDGSSCDSYIHHQKSTISNACNYNVSHYSNNLINTDNLMYHRDACSGESKYEIYSTVNYDDFDNPGEEYTYYLNGEEENGQPFSAFSASNNKILPQVPPVQHCQNLWDGICSSQYSNASLTSTPTLGNSENDWNGLAHLNYSVRAQINGHHTCDVSDGLNGIKADRILPILHSKPICVNKPLKQKCSQNNSCNTSMTAMTTTTSNAVFNNQNNIGNEMMTTELSTIQSHPGLTRYVNGTSQLSQINNKNTDFNNSYYSNDQYIIGPQSAMFVQPTEVSNDIGFNSVNNMCTYSDNIGNTTTFLNHPKLQDLQKCRYSIIMAMTTASVIASGETRIPHHLTKKLEQAGGTSATKASNIGGLSLETYSTTRHTNSGLSGNTNSSISEDSNLLTSCAYTATITVKSNNIAALPTLVTASTSMLLLSSASPIVADDYKTNNITATIESQISGTVIETTSIASRKLPKHFHCVENGQTIPSKQLPQTPQQPFITSTSTKILPTLVPSITTATLQSTHSQPTNELLTTFISTTSIMSTTTTTIAPSIPRVLALSLINSTPTSSTTDLRYNATSSPLSTNDHDHEQLYLLKNNNNMNCSNYDNNYDNNFNNCKSNSFNNNIENVHDNYNRDEFQSQNHNQHKAGIDEVLTDNLLNAPSKLTETHPFTIAVSPAEKITCAIITSISTITHASTTTISSTLSSLSSFEATTLISIENESLEITKTVPTLKKLPSKTYTETKLELLPMLDETSTETLTTETKTTLNTDYKNSFHIADYLKPYTLQTYISATDDDANSISSSCNINQSADLSYIPYYNIDHIDNSLSQSTPNSKSINFTQLTAETVALKNSGLDTSDNISSYSIKTKNSISSKEPNIDSSTTTTSCVPITLSSSVSTIVTSPMPCETLSISTYLDSQLISLQSTTIENSLNEKTNEMHHETDESSFLGKNDNYFSDYKIDLQLTSLSSTSSSSTMITSSTSNSSSLQLNNSLPITTMSLTKNKMSEAESPAMSIAVNEYSHIHAVNEAITTEATTVKFTSYTDYLKTKNTPEELPSYTSNFLPTYHADEFGDQDYIKLNEINNSYETLYSKFTPSHELKFALEKEQTENEKNKSGEKEMLLTLVNDKTESSLATKSEANELLIKQEQILTTPTPYFTTYSTESINPATTTNTLTANTASTIVDDFDDNFYDSFNVNLYSLFTDTSTSTSTTYTATTSGSEMIHCTLTPTTASFQTKSLMSLEEKCSKQVSFNVENTSKSFYNISTIGGSKGATTSSIPSSIPSSTSITHKTASSQASSLLVGLSQSLKMGLDGGLSGEGKSNIQQQPKKSFGFGLAAKLVPNVGNLLAAATKSTITTSQESNTSKIPPSTATYITVLKESPTNHTQIQEAQEDYNMIRSPLSYGDNTINATTSISTANFNEESNNNTNNYKTSSIGDDFGGSGLYYSGQPAIYHVTNSTDYVDQDPTFLNTDQVVIYANIEAKDFDDVYDVADYEEYCNSSDHDSSTTTINIVDQPKNIQNTKINSTLSLPSNNNIATTPAKRETVSITSSITNVGSHHPQITHLPDTVPTCTVTKSSYIKSSGGGMLGSFLGKAAAVMQTANDVVNQGSSMSSSKVQKNVQPTTSSLLCPGTAPVESPNSHLGVISNIDSCTYTSAVSETSNSFIRSNSLTQDDSLASSYSLSDDDYDNSNIRHSNGFNQHQIDEHEYYNLNKNAKQMHLMKTLPTVPPAGSTGKKLPTINDKSGCLVKDQPKGVYDEGEEILRNKSLSLASTYDIDSEQGDYYMDAQQAEPASSSNSMATAGYYEHKNGSYDYRNDYFNEEDEFKYLEKEQIHTKGERNVLYNNQQPLLCQMHKQSSYLIENDYQNVESEIRDEYMDDMYKSDDSDNYLDESSSASVKGISNNHNHQPPRTISTTSTYSSRDLYNKGILTSTATTPNSRTSTSFTPFIPHQQIKKQERIIMEDEKDDLPALEDLHDIMRTTSKADSHQSNIAIFDGGDDRMGDTLPSFRPTASRKGNLTRGETEEVVSGHIQIMKRKTEVTAKQRWHWAYNKIIMQLNVSTHF